MNQDEFKDKFNRFMDSFSSFLDKYEEVNPEWMNVTFSQFFYGALENLKALLENPEEKVADMIGISQKTVDNVLENFSKNNDFIEITQTFNP